MIDIDDNDNCGYFPIQVFETKGETHTSSKIIVPAIPGKPDPYEVVGWCSGNGGRPCEVSVVAVGDSGSGQALMIYGGDHGIRLKPVCASDPWRLDSPDQIGEPYLLLQTSVDLIFS